ncbi:MAG: hypothetical protein QF737_05010 [Dehalococcoidales bacterium]|jgi:hypothetical protein|nr:hypothetical protein [Dehalococcoidales bacterium]
MRKLLLILVIGILSLTVCAVVLSPTEPTPAPAPNTTTQMPAFSSTKTFGGVGWDYANSVQQTTDGGYIIAGGTDSLGTDGDVYLVKTDREGNEEWSRTFGGKENDSASSVQQTTDGGYIIAGDTNSFGAGEFDFYLVKTDREGNEEWSRAFGGVGWDYADSVQQTTDGGYIIAGGTDSFGAGEFDFYLVKTDGEGNEEWSRAFGGVGWDYADSVQQTTDGGYIIAGGTDSFGAGIYDVYLVKTDREGNEEWSRAFGGEDNDTADSVQQTADGGYIIAGDTESFGVDGDFYLVKTDGEGNEEWSRAFGGEETEEADSVQQTTDGGYIIAGYTKSFGAGNYDAYLVKTDEEGNEEWSRTFGGEENDSASSVQQTTDGGYIIAGRTASHGAGSWDAYLVKTDGDGVVEER